MLNELLKNLTKTLKFLIVMKDWCLLIVKLDYGLNYRDKNIMYQLQRGGHLIKFIYVGETMDNYAHELIRLMHIYWIGLSKYLR